MIYNIYPVSQQHTCTVVKVKTQSVAPLGMCLTIALLMLLATVRHLLAVVAKEQPFRPVLQAGVAQRRKAQHLVLVMVQRALQDFRDQQTGTVDVIHECGQIFGIAVKPLAQKRFRTAQHMVGATFLQHRLNGRAELFVRGCIVRLVLFAAVLDQLALFAQQQRARGGDGRFGHGRFQEAYVAFVRVEIWILGSHGTWVWDEMEVGLEWHRMME